MNEEKPRKIKVTIDGQEIEVERGTTILNAARELGIEIPTLCYNPLVEAYASCRICSVEVVRGKRHRIVTACNYPLEQDGLQVYTNNERVRRNRAMIIELLLARCPDVPVLQELARQYGVEESRFGKGDEKCILCGLCVRVCEEIVGVCAINFAFSGTERIVTTPFDEESDVCIACGSCAYVCPTGAITLEDFKQREVIHNEIFLGPATAIRVPTLQAVPNAPVIDTEHCIHFQTGGCG